MYKRTSHNEDGNSTQALQDSEALLKAILEALPDLKFRVDYSGLILDYFAGEADKLYLSPEHFLHKNVAEVLPPHVAEAIKYNLALCLKNETVQIFEYALPVNGTLGYYEARLSRINEKEAVAVIRNITDRKQYYETLQDKISELNLKNLQLESYISSNRDLENFAYVASHDLREPLRTMRTFAQLLQKRYGSQFDEQGNQYLDFIADGAAKLNRLIEDLLTYSRVNAEQQVAEIVSPLELVEEVLRQLAEPIADKQANMDIQWLPSTISVHPGSFRQLLQNLVYNAIKFSKPGTPPHIRLYAESWGTHWRFAVADNGIGIAAPFHEKIFALFNKLHPSAAFEGTGLGLAICKKIVLQHGGDIWVESQPGEGAVFYFTIPQ
ncbi:MAG: PAS domain S-box protein [Saprospiraceae bacterium]|nr:PAS domain S-box protein [Saprospiraceae bacterium]